MQRINRRRRGPKAWRAMLVRFASSGLTVKAFCRCEAVSAASFYRWRSQLGAAPADVAPLPVAQASLGAPAEFVDLGPLVTTMSAPARFELRLDLGDGLMLQLRRG